MKKTKNLIILLLIIALSFSLTACSKEDNSAQTSNEAEGNGETVKSQFPLTITDFLGREITIEKEPERIVSLAPSVTELIFAVGAGDRVVGVTEYDTYPEEVKDLPKVGGFKGPNIELITAQEPDIVFASTLSGKEEMETLEKMGIPVVVIEAKSIDNIYESIEMLGKITNKEEKAQTIVNEMKSKIQEISNKVKDRPKIKVFHLIDINGNWTAGSGTFIHELINLAGGQNIAEDTEGWVQYSIEELVSKNPDAIVMSSYAGDVETIKNMEGYKETNAVKNNNIYVVSNDDIISRATNRIVLGLEEIAKFLHPEVFN
jgi:iron complex transport system substrate-binding protein